MERGRCLQNALLCFVFVVQYASALELVFVSALLMKWCLWYLWCLWCAFWRLLETGVCEGRRSAVEASKETTATCISRQDLSLR
jgi:hypothetical protein